MSDTQKYLLDTDVLVASRRIHYQPGFCQAFWSWVDAGFSNEVLFSIDKVKDEIANGHESDPLSEWAKQAKLKSFFLSTKGVAAKWAEIATWAQNRVPEYSNGAKNKFLSASGADAWLIAFAAANPGYTVVTNEVPAPESKNDIKLPDAAKALGVRTINLIQLLQTHAHNNFTFRA